MNIAVLTAGGRVVVRPDTTWEKDSEDLFVPDFVSRISWTPVLYTRISKPGRSIGLKFAERYYNSFGYGVLLYPDDLADGSAEGFACACCLDHTSFLPGLMLDKSSLGEGRSGFSLRRDGEEIFSCGPASPSIAEESIAEVSRFCYLRIGDMVATELRPRSLLCTREDGRCLVSGTFRDGFPDEFNIIF